MQLKQEDKSTGFLEVACSRCVERRLIQALLLRNATLTYDNTGKIHVLKMLYLSQLIQRIGIPVYRILRNCCTSSLALVSFEPLVTRMEGRVSSKVSPVGCVGEDLGSVPSETLSV